MPDLPLLGYFLPAPYPRYQQRSQSLQFNLSIAKRRGYPDFQRLDGE